MQFREVTRPQAYVHVSSYTECGGIRLMLRGLWARQLVSSLSKVILLLRKS